MLFCLQCQILQYCRQRSSTLIVDSELRGVGFVADFRAFLVRYSFQHQVTPGQWHEHLCGLYRDYHGWIRDGDGNEVFLDMEVFEEKHTVDLFKRLLRPVPPGGQTRLREETKERVRVCATIMRAHFPEEAMMWGVRPANDN